MANILNQDNSTGLLQLVSFVIGSEEFGVDILKVQEIIRVIGITKVPNTLSYIEGVINLRGRVIPIVNLRTRVGLEKKDFDKDTRIIVVELEDKTIGFMVDSVKEVIRINQNITEPPPEIVTGINTTYITSVAKLDDRLLILIDLERIISEKEKAELSNEVELEAMAA